MERLISIHMYSVKFESHTEFITGIVDKILDDLPVTEAPVTEATSKTQSSIVSFYVKKGVKKSVHNDNDYCENQLKTKSNSVQTTLNGFVFAKKHPDQSPWSCSKDAAVFELMDSSADALLCKAAENCEGTLVKEETKEEEGICEKLMDSQEDSILLQVVEAQEEDCEGIDKIDWDSFFQDSDFGVDAEMMDLPAMDALLMEENNGWTDSELESVEMELYNAACAAEASKDS